MNAMNNASDNAKALKKSLSTVYNRKRQASITNQIFEQFIKNAQEGLRGVAKIFLKAVQ